MPFAVFMVGCWPFSRTNPLAFDIECFGVLFCYMSKAFCVLASFNEYECFCHRGCFNVGQVSMCSFNESLFVAIFGKLLALLCQKTSTLNRLKMTVLIQTESS